MQMYQLHLFLYLKYLSITQKYDAAFMQLTVTDVKWEEECPGDDKANKESYFTSIFTGMNLANKVWTTMSVKD